MTDDDIALAHRLADAAAAAIRPFFRAPFTTELKDDRSPVTQADRAAEAAMRVILDAERPQDGIVGEEYGAVRERAARTWVLDPIDGTRSFVAGRAIFGTLIALLEDDMPVLGIINQPIQNERWLGVKGQMTMFNNTVVRARGCTRLGLAHLATTGPAYFTPAGLSAFGRVSAAAGDTLWGGDCYNYGLLAAGHLDLVVEAGLRLYDFAALVPIVTGAGGAMTDWHGRPLNAASDGEVIAAGNSDLIGVVVSLLENDG